MRVIRPHSRRLVIGRSIGLAGTFLVWLAMVPAALASGAAATPVANDFQQRGHVERTSLADRRGDLLDLLVVPTVVMSGDTLPTRPVSGFTTVWTSQTPGIAISGSTITAKTPTTGRIVAVSSGPSGPPLLKTFTVTVLPARDARFLLSYTRTATIDPQVYGANLGDGLHLALGETRDRFTPLNENFGILYAKATRTEAVEINQIRGLATPYVFRMADGGYGVVATGTRSGGAPDPTAASQMILFTSKDLLTYAEVGLVTVNPANTGVRSPKVFWDSSQRRYLVTWRDVAGQAHHNVATDLTAPGAVGAPKSGGVAEASPARAAGIDGAVPSNRLVIDTATAHALQVRFGRIRNVGVKVEPLTIAVGEKLDVTSIRAQLAYDDGSIATRSIDWDRASLDAVKVDRPGEYTITGKVRQTFYPFPFIVDRADPSIIKYGGRYLFIATPGDGNGLYLRSSETINGLRDAPENVILGKGNDIAGLFWAPELHLVDGKLTVFFAPGQGADCWCAVQSYVMQLEGGDPTRAADWGTAKPVLTASGGKLQRDARHPGISLDMTYFEATRADGSPIAYVAWSQRYIIGKSQIGDAQLWIATIDPANPWRLTSDPVKFATAEYGWDHNMAAVVEAPYVIRRGDTLFMTYSGSATDKTYLVGLLSAAAGADLLDPASWTKSNYPALKSDPATGQVGPGHNMFALDEDGNEIMVYHARNSGASRDAAVRRIHWSIDGMPILDMSPDEEVAPRLRAVTTTITVLAAP